MPPETPCLCYYFVVLQPCVQAHTAHVDPSAFVQGKCLTGLFGLHVSLRRTEYLTSAQSLRYSISASTILVFSCQYLSTVSPSLVTTHQVITYPSSKDQPSLYEERLLRIIQGSL